MSTTEGSRYVNRQRIGSGAMGLVFRAYDTALDRDVALKQLNPPPGVDPAEARDRFIIEARAAARLAHPNILRIHDSFWEDEHVFIAMELIAGETLGDIAMRGAQPALVVREVMSEVAKALAAAHAAGIIHRDLKPQNIFWTPEGRVVVADFGLARIGPGRGTVEGTVMGTPGYMAPEQVRGSVVGPTADVFGWGTVAYELAMGIPAFGDPHETDSVALAYKIVNEEPTRPIEVPDDPALAQLIRRCLAKDAGRRPADGGALVAELATGRPAAPPAPGGERSVKTPLLVAGGLAAAAVVVVVALALAGGSEPGHSTQPKPTPPITATTTTTTTTPPPTVDTRPLVPFPAAPGAIPAGRYQTDIFQPRVTFTLTPGWRSIVVPQEGAIQLQREDRLAHGLAIMRPDRLVDPAIAPQNVADFFSAIRDLTDIPTWLCEHGHLSCVISSDIVGGQPRQRVDVRVKAGQGYRTPFCGERLGVACVITFVQGISATVLWADRTYSIYIGPGPLITIAEAPPDTMGSFIGLAKDVIASIALA